MFELIQNQRDFLVIDKFPGVSFHRDREERGLVEVIKAALGLSELYTVHRLDRVTSGLLIFAKNPKTAKELSGLFRNGEVNKYYLAISDRTPKKKQGMVKGDMLRSRRGGWRLARTLGNPAITHFYSASIGSGMRLFLIKPITGKTHQIRVAMKSIGAPILGDSLYHGPENIESDRAYLHSYAARFWLHGAEHAIVHKPGRGIYFRSEATKRVLETYETPWMIKWPHIKSQKPVSKDSESSI